MWGERSLIIVAEAGSTRFATVAAFGSRNPSKATSVENRCQICLLRRHRCEKELTCLDNFMRIDDKNSVVCVLVPCRFDLACACVVTTNAQNPVG